MEAKEAMAGDIRKANIISSFRLLKGNTKVTVLCEPMWGIPFNLFNFYLSLYMKSQGVTDKQIGYLISIGFVFSIIFSLYGGIITDALGRKKTTIIFDFIAWPLCVVLYFFSGNFWMFALATFANSFVRIVSISWNLMFIEDADSDQRQAAFNLLNIINISAGIIIPTAGIFVSRMGIVKAERIFLAFGAISMIFMIIIRNHFYTETKIGQQILNEKKNGKSNTGGIKLFYRDVFKVMGKRPGVLMALCVLVLYNIFIPIGSYSSLYFAPYMTERMKIDVSLVSILGGAYSITTLIIFIFINPLLAGFNRTRTMITGLAIQIFSFILLITVPGGSLYTTIICVAIYASGFSIFRPLIDSLFADYTEGNLRAGFYSLMNTATCALTAVMGAFSGYLYEVDPRSIYILSIIIQTICIVILAATFYNVKKQSAEA
jgi:MFS family permease